MEERKIDIRDEALSKAFSADVFDKPIPQRDSTLTSSSNSTFEDRDATEQEIKTLPLIVDKIPIAAWIVIIAGGAERFTYFGIIAPWQNYMQNPRGNRAVPGALDMGQATASNIYNAFFLVSFLTPMLFAVISDSWLGRYKTLLVGLVMYLFGCVVMLVSSLPFALDRGAGLPGLLITMVFVALGAGAVKSTYYPLLGDQYVQTKPKLKRLKNNQLAVVDKTTTIQCIYNIYYWVTNVASLSVIPITFLEKEYDFWVAFILTLASIVISIIFFVAAAPRLVKVSPQGNILPKAMKTLACAARSGFKLEHAKPAYQLSRYGRHVQWSDLFVDEIRRGLLACRVIFSFLIFYLCITQMYNNLVSQAGQMDLNGVPNDMIQAFSGVACVILGPIIQYLYSFLAKRKIEFGPIARITAAFIFCSAGMAYSSGLQKLIYSTGPCYDRPLACAASENAREPNDISVWTQMPVYFILAIAEILGFVTASEYAYSKAPRDMKTVVQAFTQLTAGLASVLGMALSPVSKDPAILIMYACLAAAMAVSAVLVWWFFHKYDARDRELNDMILEESTNRTTEDEERVEVNQ